MTDIIQESKGDIKYKITLQNMVCTVDLHVDKQIDLKKLSQELPNVRYDPRRFPGLILHVKEYETKVLLFKTGRIVVTGARDMETVKKTIKYVCDLLAKYDVHCQGEPDIKIQNMVGNGKIYYYVNLDILAEKDIENAEYNPEQFPGLVYRLKLGPNREIKFLVFRNGQIVITGAKSIEEMKKATEELIRKLLKEGVLIPEDKAVF